MSEQKMREALQGFLNIVSESRGVDGYHLNGDIAEWDEFPEVDLAYEALAQPTEAVDCIWSAHNDAHMPNTFDGSCGVRWSFIDGDPIGNGMRFCPYCGGRVWVSAYEAKRSQP